MVERTGGASALLGMRGFVVLTDTDENGELWLLVETDHRVVGCPNCGVRAVGHGRSVVQVRDLPMGGRPVRLLWRKRRWRCNDSDCATVTFTERNELIEGPLSTRAALEICRLVGEDGRSVAEVARCFGIGWHSAWAAVERHGRPMIDDPRRLHGVRALGVDEHKMLAAGPTHHSVFATQLVDLDSNRLLDVVKNRSAASVSGWLAERTRWFQDHLFVAAIDPHAGYSQGALDIDPQGRHHRRRLPRGQARQRLHRRRPPAGPARDARSPGPARRPAVSHPPAAHPRL